MLEPKHCCLLLVAIAASCERVPRVPTATAEGGPATVARPVPALPGGALTWHTVRLHSTRATLWAITGSERDDVYVAGEGGTVLHSTDGGTSWSEVVGLSGPLVAGWTRRRDDVFVLGGDATLWRSTDGGRTFRSTALGGEAVQTRAIWGRGTGELWVGGERDDKMLDFMKTGRLVTREYRSLESGPISVGGETGGTLFHSVDDGRTFDEAIAVTLEGIAGIWGQGPRLFLAGPCTPGSPGAPYYFGRGKVLDSRDGGRTWQISLIPKEFLDLDAVFGAGEVVVLAGWEGDIVRSRDGGASWQLLAGPASRGNSMPALWGDATDDLYLVGPEGRILHSTDAGATWQRMKSPTSRDLYGIWGSGPGDLYAVGAGGTLLHAYRGDER